MLLNAHSEDHDDHGTKNYSVMHFLGFLENNIIAIFILLYT